MNYKVTIEETIVQDFEVEANSREEAYEIARKKYRDNEFVLESSECNYQQMSIPDEKSGDLKEWQVI